MQTGNEMDEQFTELKSRFEFISQQLELSTVELDQIFQDLSELRNRQKTQFGELLLRTTLNKPICELLQEALAQDLSDLDNEQTS